MMAQRRYFVVVDTRVRGAQALAARVVRQLEDGDADVQVVWLHEPAEASFAVDRDVQGRPALVAVGGDALFHALAPVAVARSLTLGLVPAEPSVAARALRVPERMEEAVALIVAGNARPVDVGDVNGKVFFSHVIVGNDVEGMVDASMTARETWGCLGCLLAALRGWLRARIYRVTMVYGGKDGKDATTNMVQVAVSLNPSPQGMYKLVVHTLLVYRKRQLAALLPMLMRGDRGLWPDVKGRTTDSLHLTADTPLPIRVDGVVATQTPAVFKVRDGAVWVFG